MHYKKNINTHGKQSINISNISNFKTINTFDEQLIESIDCDMKTILDKKLVYFFINGWYQKDVKLYKYMINYNKNVICYTCKSVCRFSSIKLSKTVPYKTIRRDVYEIYKSDNNITNAEIEDKLKATVNTYCICKKCFSTLDVKDIPFAPRNLNDILNRYDCNLNYENYKNIHKTLKERNKNLYKVIKRLERDNDNMVVYKNKLEEESKKIKQYLTIYKIKNDQIKIIKNDNSDMFDKIKIETAKIFNDFKKQTVKQFNNVNLIIDDFISNNNIECGNHKLECKLCSNSEIECVLNCGHMYCNNCISRLKSNYKNDINRYRQYLENDEINDQYEFDNKPQLVCPECRCNIKKVTPLFFT